MSRWWRPREIGAGDDEGEQPPFLNKTDTNSLLTAFVDGERSIAWIADRFNGVPTTPTCSQLLE